MAQHPKETVDRRIRDAALRVFADYPFDAASMAEIARTAEISTGNIYHYYKSKKDLFEAIVANSLAQKLVALVEKRVAALSGRYDVNTLPEDAVFFTASETLLSLCITHRLETVILLTRGKGTVYESFRTDLERLLIDRALDYFSPRTAPEKAHLGLCLEMIYSNFIDNMAGVLHRFESEEDIVATIKDIERYHLAGMRALLLEK